jgi:drug/metabolite transporter (DMT)-like permease
LTGPLSLIQGWASVEQQHLLLLATASLFLSAAYFLVIVAMRTGEMSLVAPFRYSSLIYALMIGWLFWNDIPNLLSWAGITLIVLAGLAMLHFGRPAP